MRTFDRALTSLSPLALLGILAAIDVAIVLPFRKALADLGYVEGRSITVEIRNANGNIERGHAIIDEFVAMPWTCCSHPVLLPRGTDQVTE